MIAMDKFFDLLEDEGMASYHDGALLDAKFENEKLVISCLRHPRVPKAKAGDIEKYITIAFYGVKNLEVYDDDKREYIPYTEGVFLKGEKTSSLYRIDGLDFVDEEVVFEECVRFKCTDFEVIAKSSTRPV